MISILRSSSDPLSIPQYPSKTSVLRGLEGEIPGAWVDSAPSEPKTVYGYGLELLLGPVLVDEMEIVNTIS
jgi:hypothetical protein